MMLDIATAAARDAGALLRERFHQPRSGVGTKSSSTDMVSDADRLAEDSIASAIRAARPDDALLGEETGETAGTSGVRWIIDPLDGTTNFLFGIPQWAVSVACEDAAGMLAGVVFDPIRDELFAAARGAGATLNGVGIRVSEATDLSHALIATGFSYVPDERATAARALAHLLPRVRDVRRAGAASLDLAWTACGRLDGYYEAPCHPWDRAAGEILIVEAGGIVAPMPAIGPSGPGVVAAGPGIFDHLRVLVDDAAAAARSGSSP